MTPPAPVESQRHAADAMSPREREARTMEALPLTPAAFAPYGDVFQAEGEPDRIINRGRCARFDTGARLDLGGRLASISLLRAEPREMPYQLNMVERPATGSHAYLPMAHEHYLVMVCRDNHGLPDRPVAFLAGPEQGIHYHNATWRSVLTPITEPGLFALIEAAGPTPEMQEFWFEKPYFVRLAG